MTIGLTTEEKRISQEAEIARKWLRLLLAGNAIKGGKA